MIYEIVGVSDNLDSLFNYVVIMELEMMRVAAPHIGVEPCAGAKTDVMGFPRVVVECLLALAQHTRGRTAIEIVDLHEYNEHYPHRYFVRSR